MALKRAMRLLVNKWTTERGWPKRLEWIEIHGIRGWAGQRIDFGFPMVAIVGENGVGKSTILQSIASIYRAPPNMKGFFPTDFFPDTPWETIKKGSIRWSAREGNDSSTGSVRKLTRWRGYQERRERPVVYMDLRRTQPVASRVGYAAIAKPKFKEVQKEEFTEEHLKRLRDIMGRNYDFARLSLTDADEKRSVQVLDFAGSQYSGFHQGGGEVALLDILGERIDRYSIVLIDEIETSLHPRAQRRLINDLAERCRTRDLQIVFTTHSPYVLEELPAEGRAYVMDTTEGKAIVTGVSPFFAMTKMDEEPHPECDIYVEDDRAETMLREVLAAHARSYVARCRFIPFGAASVGQALGQMVAEERFPRPSLVFLDGDQEASTGCLSMPGDDAPERVVFERLASADWLSVHTRVGRSASEVIDACERAMTLSNHHDWVKYAADRLTLGGDTLWQAMSAAWATNCMDAIMEVPSVTDPVGDALSHI